MSATRDGWYISDADGNTVGPLTRMELVAQHTRGTHGAGALAWHVDLAEWRPLERIAAATAPEMRAPVTTAEERADARAEARVVRDRAEKSRAEAPRPPRPAKGAKTGKGGGDDGRRLLAGKPVDLEALKRMPPAQRAEALKAGVAQGTAETGARASIALRRFVARVLDTLTLGLLGGSLAWAWWGNEFFASLGFPLAPEPWVLLFAAILAWIPIEALALAIFGTTPGKALLGLRVAQQDGKRASLGRAIKRGFQVLFRGLGLGIPVIGIITMIVAFARYTGQGRSSWDSDLGLEVRAEPIEAWRWQAALFAGFVAFLVLSSGFWGELASTAALP
ncbi:MAG TPA: RDD family protein [Xanthomonadales bacterium]|nr:RDD family protein [Xanthomonadales bacterium]